MERKIIACLKEMLHQMTQNEFLFVIYRLLKMATEYPLRDTMPDLNLILF